MSIAPPLIEMSINRDAQAHQRFLASLVRTHTISHDLAVRYSALSAAVEWFREVERETTDRRTAR